MQKIQKNNFNDSKDAYFRFNVEVLELINNFFYEYFSNIDDVLNYNIQFIEENGFEYKTEIDYMRLNRFTSTAYNTLISLDQKLSDNLLTKFYKDLIFLNNFYKKYIKNHHDAAIIYKQQFLPYYKGIETIAKNFKTIDKNLELFDDIAELNQLIQREFTIEFEKNINLYQNDLRDIINTKNYYFDHLLWHEAKKSSTIIDFYKKSIGEEIKIDDMLSTKLYIQQYLKSIQLKNTSTNTSDNSLHNYLQQVIKIMD